MSTFIYYTNSFTNNKLLEHIMMNIFGGPYKKVASPGYTSWGRMVFLMYPGLCTLLVYPSTLVYPGSCTPAGVDEGAARVHEGAGVHKVILVYPGSLVYPGASRVGDERRN